ncbi:unnamed protein product [Paramecium primaurelia]|uniref:Uncharacterized protein n=1 Tax=Paramecium primaurelia TaxID=5886 RepID=A0A8S1M7Y3_PARPR|nr:unnamed protein product [Paramecium primaurelia]
MSILKVTIKNKGVEIANEEYQYENIVQLMDKLKKAHGQVQNKIKEIIDTLGAEGVKKVKKNPKEEQQEENDDNGDDGNDGNDGDDGDQDNE